MLNVDKLQGGSYVTDSYQAQCLGYCNSISIPNKVLLCITYTHVKNTVFLLCQILFFVLETQNYTVRLCTGSIPWGSIINEALVQQDAFDISSNKSPWIVSKIHPLFPKFCILHSSAVRLQPYMREKKPSKSFDLHEKKLKNYI